MSNRNSILLLAPSFDPITAKDCTLLMNIGLDHISYAIVNNAQNRIEAVFDEQECEDIPKKIAQLVRSDSYLTQQFRAVKIAIHTENKINVPNELYDEADLSIQAQFFPGTSITNLYQNSWKMFELITIFSIPKPLEAFFSEHFPNANLFAGSPTPFIAEKDGLFINFTVGALGIGYTQNQQLIFVQTYEISDTDEFNYYLLLIISQLKINTSQTAVYLSGIVHQGDERHQCLAKYFPQINFLTVDPQLDQEILDDMPAHYYVDLLALYSCE